MTFNKDNFSLFAITSGINDTRYNVAPIIRLPSIKKYTPVAVKIICKYLDISQRLFFSLSKFL